MCLSMNEGDSKARKWAIKLNLQQFGMTVNTTVCGAECNDIFNVVSVGRSRDVWATDAQQLLGANRSLLEVLGNLHVCQGITS